MQDVVIKILTVFACLTFLWAISIFPRIGLSLLGCIVRWKESVNLHASVSLSRMRDSAAWLLVPTFLLLCSEFDIYPAIWPLEAWPSIARTSLVFAIYLIVRALCNLVFKGRKTERKDFYCANCCQRNFFIILVFIMALTFCVSFISGFTREMTRNVLGWEIVVVYAVHLLRKTQIFTHYVGFFAGFLYLCTLEILPTGLLVAPLLLK